MAAHPLDNLPAGSDVFLDANVLIYWLCNRSTQCHHLLERCAKEEVYGVTSLHVVAEVTHRLMLVEAVEKGIIRKESSRDLEQRLDAIPGLSKYWVDTESILNMNLLVFHTLEQQHRQAHAVRSAHGLLTNDSLIVAVMQEWGLHLLASADANFDHIPGLARFSPTDVLV